MKVTKEKKRELFKRYSPKKSEIDSGSPQSQVALFTHRINHLTEHLKVNKKDHSSRLSLIKMVGKRKKLLKYIKLKDLSAYNKVSFYACSEDGAIINFIVGGISDENKEWQQSCWILIRKGEPTEDNE